MKRGSTVAILLLALMLLAYGMTSAALGMGAGEHWEDW